MSAGKYDFVIEAGTDWQVSLWLRNEDDTPKDLTDYTAKMHIREKLEGPLIKELATDDKGIVITGNEGMVFIFLRDDETQALQIKKGVYSLELISPEPEKVTRLLEGEVTVSPEVTR